MIPFLILLLSLGGGINLLCFAIRREYRFLFFLFLTLLPLGFGWFNWYLALGISSGLIWALTGWHGFLTLEQGRLFLVLPANLPEKAYLLIDAHDRIGVVSEPWQDILPPRLSLERLLTRCLRITKYDGDPANNQEFKNHLMLFRDNQRLNNEYHQITFKDFNDQTNFFDYRITNLYTPKHRYLGMILAGNLNGNLSKFEVSTILPGSSDQASPLPQLFDFFSFTSAYYFLQTTSPAQIRFSESYRKYLNLTQSVISTETYESLLNDLDLLNRQKQLHEMADGQTITLQYGVSRITSIDFIEETVVYQAKTNSYLAQVTPQKLIHFEKSNLTELDNLSHVKDLEEALTKLVKQTTPFYCLTFRVELIKQINREHNREIGSFCLNQVLKEYRDMFGLANVYRIEGLLFAVIIFDKGLISFIDHNRQVYKEGFTMTKIDFGGRHFLVPSQAGIASYPVHAQFPVEVLNHSLAASQKAVAQGKGLVYYGE